MQCSVGQKRDESAGPCTPDCDRRPAGAIDEAGVDGVKHGAAPARVNKVRVPQADVRRALSAGPEVLWLAALAEAEVLGHCHCFVEVAGQGPARDGDRRMGGRRPAHQKRTIPAR